MGKKSKLFIAAVLTGSMAISGLGLTFMSQKKQVKADTTTYHATLGIQTANILWLQHKGYYAKITGGDGNTEAWTAGEDALKHLFDTKALKTYDSTFTDVEITGDGTYTVSLDGANFAGERTISQLYVSTDIPYTSVKTGKCAATFSNMIITINGKQIVSFDSPYIESVNNAGNETQLKKSGVCLLAMNHWRSDLVTILANKGIAESKITMKDSDGVTATYDNGYVLLNGTGSESVSITFTVSGFSNLLPSTTTTSAPASTAAVSGTNTTSTSSTTNASDSSLPAKNDEKTINGLKYVVTKSDKTNGTVMLKKNMKKEAVKTVPDKVKWNGYSFSVTSIGNQAFAKDKKIKKITIGKKVSSIGSKAFYKCSKLKLINLKGNTVLKKVGSKAVSGVSSSLKITADKSKLSTYKKLFD